MTWLLRSPVRGRSAPSPAFHMAAPGAVLDIGLPSWNVFAVCRASFAKDVPCDSWVTGDSAEAKMRSFGRHHAP